MKETEKRIKRYVARLPRAREKVIASLVLFAFALSMLTVATFSWVTLSIAPEATGITTTVAANGNLEIALVNTAGTEPQKSQIGDSVAQISARNITWGNLINLTDPAYGLEHIVLRPASLNAADLLNEPLYAATYTSDGRIKRLDSDFAYTVYNPTNKTFVQSNNKGIRAISSVVYEEIPYENPLLADFAKKLTEAERQIAEARLAFNGLSADMNGITGLMSTYMNGVLRSNIAEEKCEDQDILALYNLMVKVDEQVMDVVGSAFMLIFEVYQTQTDNLTVTGGNAVNYTPTKFATLDEFCSGALNELATMNAARATAKQDAIVFSALSSYITDRAILKADIEDLSDEAEKITNGVAVGLKWGDIEETANDIIEIKTVELNGKTMSEWFTGLSEKIMELVNVLNGSASDNNVVVYSGMLERLDRLLHNGMGFYVKEIVIQFDKEALKARLPSSVSWAAGMVSNKVNANIRTNAITALPVSMTTTDLAEADKVVDIPTYSIEFTAKETYGLALDLWLRTNNNSSFLILEGDVVTESIPVKETVQYYVEGSNVPTTAKEISIYITDIHYKTTVDYAAEDQTDPEPSEYSLYDQEVFSITTDGTTSWYMKNSGEKIALGDTTTQTKDENDVLVSTKTVTVSFPDTPEEKENVNIIGYSGANRIWGTDELPFDYNAATSTSQGSGSCYTFYTDSPEDMAQSLELVAALKVAFVNGQTGQLLATAHFDTNLYFAEYGKVTVPLYLDSDSEVVTTEADGDIRVISAMPWNEATMITAIVYLDGSLVTNNQVLADTQIDGTLNLQFGSYTHPDALDDGNLMNKVREITASLEKTYNFTGSKGEDRTVTVNLNVAGDEPNTITANFLRVISKTHGTRCDTFTFNKTAEGGKWSGSVVLEDPGTFILRSVTVDGIEYSLIQENLPTVLVPGFSIQAISGEKGIRHIYRTAENYVTEKFDIIIAASPTGWPQSVKGVFQGEKGSTITANFTGIQANWTTNVTFTNSDTYTLEYIIIDGEYFSIDPIVREVYTGLYARVMLQPADTYTEDEEQEINSDGIKYFYTGDPHEFTVSVEIFDNANNELEALGNVKLYYSGNLDADLSWNATTGCYDGEEFLIEMPGSYSFEYVTVSGEVINKAPNAATITAATKDPVRYLGISNAIEDYVVKLDVGTAATITLNFENAPAASVYGLFAKSMSGGAAVALADDSTTSVTYIVMKAANNGDSTHTFHIPAEDGYWTLMDIKVATVFDGVTEIFHNGNSAAGWPSTHTSYVTIDSIEDGWTAKDEFTDADGNAQDYYYDIDDLKYQSDIRSTKVVASIQSTNNFAPKTFTGSFMQEHTVSGLNISFFDFEGDVLKEEAAISNVQLKFIYGDNHEAYGGYDSATITASSGSFNVDLTPDASNKVFTQSADATVIYAGTYSSNLYYTVGEETLQRTLVGPSLTVTSTAPSVIISAVNTDTNTEIPTRITWKTSSSIVGTSMSYTLSNPQTNSLNTDRTEVTVYAKATTSNNGVSVGTGDAGFVHPKLKFTAVGVDESTKVTFVIPKGNAANAITVSLTGTTESSEYTLGSITGKIKETSTWFVTYTVWGYNGHGNQTIDKVTVTTGDGIVCTVTLDKPIVIHNPSSVNQTS